MDLSELMRNTSEEKVFIKKYGKTPTGQIAYLVSQTTTDDGTTTTIITADPLKAPKFSLEEIVQECVRFELENPDNEGKTLDEMRAVVANDIKREIDYNYVAIFVDRVNAYYDADKKLIAKIVLETMPDVPTEEAVKND